MDRALAFFKSFVVASRASPPPIAPQSSSASPSAAAARLPSLLDYAVKALVRPRECVVFYSQHPRRIGHAHPVIQPPSATRVFHVIECAVRSLGMWLPVYPLPASKLKPQTPNVSPGIQVPSRQEVRESKTVSGGFDIPKFKAQNLLYQLQACLNVWCMEGGYRLQF